MTNDHQKLQDLMDRVGQPKFGGWTSAQEMADQAMAVYAAEGIDVDPARVQDFSLDIFKGVSRLPLKLPEGDKTAKEKRWEECGGWATGWAFLGMLGFIFSLLGFGLFGPGHQVFKSTAFMMVGGGFMAIHVLGFAGLMLTQTFQPSEKESKRRSEEAMRALLDTSSTSAIEDLLRHPDRTPEVESLAWEELRRRKLRGEP